MLFWQYRVTLHPGDAVLHAVLVSNRHLASVIYRIIAINIVAFLKAPKAPNDSAEKIGFWGSELQFNHPPKHPAPETAPR